MTSVDDPLFSHGLKFHQPDLIGISVRKIQGDDEVIDDLDVEKFVFDFIINYFNCQTNQDGRQIPVISDIERIKKVIEIIAFVGEKVGELVDKIDIPSHQMDERKATENPQETET